MTQFGDLFTARQKLALCNFIEIIRALENIPRMEELLTLTLAHTIEPQLWLTIVKGNEIEVSR